MFVAYYLEAILLTFYAVLIIWDNIYMYFHDGKCSLPNRSRTFKRIAIACKDTISRFLGDAVLFASAVQVAAIYASRKPAKLQRQTITNEALQGLLLGNLSFIIVVLLYWLRLIVVGIHPRQRLLRGSRMIAILWAFLVINFWILTVRSIVQHRSRAWEFFCYGSGRSVTLPTVATVITLLLVVYCSFLVWLGLPDSWRIVPGGAWKRKLMGKMDSPRRRNVFPICLILILWSGLVEKTIDRQGLINEPNSANEEGQWSFGQILALFTWAPTIIEFALVFRFERLSS